ncbi:MAG: GNAT family N-acetyltransferase [Methanobacteriota archaeon]
MKSEKSSGRLDLFAAVKGEVELPGMFQGVLADIKPPVEDDIPRIVELSQLLRERDHLTEAGGPALISGGGIPSYHTYCRVYKQEGVVQGFTAILVNDMSNVGYLGETVVDPNFRFGVGALMDAQLMTELEETGITKFFTNPNEHAVKGCERVGFAHVDCDTISSSPDKFYAIGMTTVEVAAENARKHIVGDYFHDPASEGADSLNSWVAFNKYCVSRTPHKFEICGGGSGGRCFISTGELQDMDFNQTHLSLMLHEGSRDLLRWQIFRDSEDPIKLPQGFNPVDDLALSAARYRVEGPRYRSELYDSLDSGVLHEFRKYLWLRKFHDWEEFDKQKEDVEIGSNLPCEVTRGGKTIWYPNPPGHCK